MENAECRGAWIGRIKMRVKPSDKERFSRAAELSGVKLTTFVRFSYTRSRLSSRIKHRARRAERRHDRGQQRVVDHHQDQARHQLDCT